MSDPHQELFPSATSNAPDSVREFSPTSDVETVPPASKMRRRWQLNSKKAASAALLPMEDSPGSSGVASSWQMVAPPHISHFDVESVSDEPCTTGSCFGPERNRSSLPARGLFQPSPKPKAWQRPQVCLRFNSPFQVDQSGPKPIARPAGSSPAFQPQARWSQQPPQQRERVSWGRKLCLCLALVRPTTMLNTLVRLPRVPLTPLCSARPLLPHRLAWKIQVHSQPRLLLFEPHAQLQRRPALCVLWIRMRI